MKKMVSGHNNIFTSNKMLCLYNEVLQSYDNNTWLLDTKHIMVNKKYFT